MDRSYQIKTNRRWRVKWLLPSFVVVFFLLSACGDFWESETAELFGAQDMHIGRRVVTMVQGDRYCPPVNFDSDSLFNQTVYWESLDTTVCAFVNDTLHARQPGLTRIVAFTTIDRLRDTCYVQVLPPLQTVYGNYPYDMMLYASVDVHGTPLTIENSDSFLIAAYAGDELRGTGTMMRHLGIDYMMMRMESPFSYGEPLTLRCYFVGQARFELFPDTLIFTGETYGTLSSLYPLVLDQRAEVYEPVVDDEIIVVPDTITVEI